MPDQDWTKPKPLGESYSDPYDKDSDRITVTRGYIMWVMRETARLSAIVQTVELENASLKSDLQMEKDNEDRLVREWQRANNEIHGLNSQVAALIDNQTSLKAEVESLKKPAVIGGYNISEYIRMSNSETLEFDNGDIFADMTLPERIKYIVESHARLKAECQARQAENSVLAVECDSLKAEVERLRKAGDEMAKNYFDTYWALNAESTSRHEPASITNWEEAKQNQ